VTRAFTFAAGPFLESRDQVGTLRLVHVERRVYVGLDHALALVLERLHTARDLGEHVQAPVLGQHAHQILRIAESFPARIEMNNPATFAADRFGSPNAARIRSSDATEERFASAPDHSASLPCASASRKTASA
jgi:hypothetical protein